MARPQTRDVVEKRRYRKVSTRMYFDQNFLELSPAKPSGQSLWLYLITGPHTTVIPGLFVAGEAQLAEALGWRLSDFRRCWDEIASRGMAESDWRARLVWLPNAVRHNEPESPNVVNAWRTAMAELPDCALRRRADSVMADFLDAKGVEWLDAWQTMGGDYSRFRRWLRDDPTRRAEIKRRDGDLCRYCGRQVSWTDRRGPLSGTYDHIDPEGDNAMANVVTACRSCNSKKRKRTPEQAGMTLLPAPEPKSDPGPDLDRLFAESRPPSPNQEQEQEQEGSPLPPASGGRITRAERQRAEELRRRAFGCTHEPRCPSYESCITTIVLGLREQAVTA